MSTTSNSTEPKLFESPDSDFTLISKEGHRFPVKKIVLLANSSVFEDILSLPSDSQEAELKVDETTKILDLFLRFLHRGPNPEDLPLDILRELLVVLDKYDVEILYPVVVGATYSHVSKSPMEVWALLTIHKQFFLAKECYKHMDGSPDVGAGGKLGSVRYEQTRWAPSFVPLDLMERLPVAELQKLMKAYEMIARGYFPGWTQAAGYL